MAAFDSDSKGFELKISIIFFFFDSNSVKPFQGIFPLHRLMLTASEQEISGSFEIKKKKKWVEILSRVNNANFYLLKKH